MFCTTDLQHCLLHISTVNLNFLFTCWNSHKP